MRGPKPITYAREVYSPSQLELAKRCLRSWVLRYIYGEKTHTAASRSKILGTLIHKCVEIYIGGRSMLSLTLDDLDDYTRKEVDAFVAYRSDVLFAKALKANPYANHAQAQVNAANAARKEVEDLLREAPQRALAGLAHLPPLEQCAQRFAELPLVVNTSGFYDYAVEFSEMSKLDLVVQAASGEWYLYDHKSTKGKPGNPWAYVPTPEQLKQSVQLLLYAASVMQRAGAQQLWCRWVYYYTGQGAPDSKAVDVCITYQEAVENLQPWLELADQLGAIIRETKARNTLPPLEQFEFPGQINSDDSPCDAYGGCGYRGALCNPPPISAAQILERTRSAKQTKESKGDTMGLGDRVAQQQANGAPVLPSMVGVPQQQPNPAGFNYTPNVNGQFVVAPPGHPAHTGVPAGYQYPPGPVPVAGGVVEVPSAPPFSQTSHTPSPEEVDAVLAAHPLPEPEAPKRKRRTKAEASPVNDVPELTTGTPEYERVQTELSALQNAEPGNVDTALLILSERSVKLACEINVNIRFAGGVK